MSAQVATMVNPQAKPYATLDTTGEVCPYPALLMKEAIQALPRGEALEVITNNKATVISSLPVLCRTLGARADVESQGDRWRILIRKH